MIFVTLGTHEQPFDRLIRAVDELKGAGAISGDVFIQTGYSRFRPIHCRHEPFVGFEEMLRLIGTADVVITHGGTGSVMLVLYAHKIPIVTPRQKRYGEHIDDHQVQFCRMMESKDKALAVYDMADLAGVINGYGKKLAEWRADDSSPAIKRLDEQAAAVCRELETICSQWFPPANAGKTGVTTI